MSHNATTEGSGMSIEETKLLSRDIAAMAEDIREIRREIKDGFAALPCKEQAIKIAKMEQRIEINGANAASSRMWTAMIAGWVSSLIGWGIVIALFLLKR